MSTRRLISCSAVAALALAAAAPTVALARSSDAAATQAYVQANYTLVQAARTRLGTSEAALQTVLGGVRRDCPRAATGSPQDEDSTALSNEVVLTMRVAATQPDLRAIASFTRTVAGLRWSNRKLTSTIQMYVRELKTLSATAAPKLCVDVRSWVASGYRTLPASTMQLNSRFEALNLAIGELPASLLAPYEGAEQRSIVHRTNQLEVELTDGEARAVETWGHIMDTIGLNP